MGLSVASVLLLCAAGVFFWWFYLRRFCVDTAPRNLQVYEALRSPSVREAASALERRIALAVRESRRGYRTCSVCAFANTTQVKIASCALCGAPLDVPPRRGLGRLLPSTPVAPPSEDELQRGVSSRQRRVRRRREWTRQLDEHDALVWVQDAQSQDLSSAAPFVSYVLQSTSCTNRTDDSTVEDQGPATITVTIDPSDDTKSSLTQTVNLLRSELEATTIRVVDARNADASRMAFTAPITASAATAAHTVEFPTKLVNFMTSVASLLSEASAAETPSVAHVQIARGDLWTDSVEAIATMPATQARFPIRVAFVGEPGIDAGALYREWVGLLNKTLVTPEAGIFTCVDAHEQTFYLNRHSRDVLGESHLAHCLVAGRLIGRGLLDGNATGFQLAPPLLKIMLGLPVSFEDLEYYDAEAFKSLQWLVANNGVDALGLDFTVVEKLPDGSTKVVELVPGGSDKDVTDTNKLEYVDRKLQYLLFESVESQLFAFLTGLYDVVPAELLTAFDAEELSLLLSGSDEIDVDDWEANTLAFVDDGRGNSGKPVMLLPCYENFWKVVRALSNDERRRLLHFATGSTRPPPGGFSSLTSYDGRLALFTLRGVEESATHGYLQSHACFNRLDLPTFWGLSNMRKAIYAAISSEEDGFTIA